MLGVIVIAGLEAMPPSSGHTIIIVGMDYSSPAELILVPGKIEILASVTKESQCLWTNIGEPSGGVGRPCVAGHALNNSHSASCFVVGCRKYLEFCRH